MQSDLSPDIVSIVEIWSDEYKGKMIDCVKSKYPYYMFFKKKEFIKIGSGLLLLSKYPLSDPSFVAYNDLQGWDDMSQKGIGAVIVSLNSTRKFRIFWTHVQSGSSCTEDRFKNLDQAMKLVNTYNPSLPAIFVGDLNLVLNETYTIEYSRFIALFGDFEDSFGENPICFDPTVDPVTNSMASRFCGKDCHVERDDFLMFYPKGNTWSAKDFGVIHDWKCKVEDHGILYEFIDCSDHYPIFAKIEFNN